MIFASKKLTLPDPSQALPGRDTGMPVKNKHFVSGNPIVPPFPANLKEACFGMGCFWGVERKFWQQAGVLSTAVGYSGGYTKNPTYDEVCTGLTGHNEVVKVIFDPAIISYNDLLRLFWQSHNPIQGMQQGNDIGTQYRSGIYTNSPEQLDQALESKKVYQKRLTQAGFKLITTEIIPLDIFYYAEEYHQQYLAKEPMGYCGLRGLGVDYAESLMMASKKNGG
jgi:peptide-methionine (S)-S-oxide reductase